ncbi:MAG: hypothetical protein QOJ25_298 [Solirubrobacteraceae bacterium]|nr:hypothetical protein [Solirubrobacteraceae bacterium]
MITQFLVTANRNAADSVCASVGLMASRRRLAPAATATAAATAAVTVTVTLILALSACAGAGGPSASSSLSAPAASLLHWSGVHHVKRVVDLAGPARDGTLVVATNGRLALLRPAGRSRPSPAGRLRPFARGPNGYSGSAGLEPYITLATGQRDRRAGCGFGAGTVYALRLGGRRGVTAVDAAGVAHDFVNLPGRGLENGIAFDSTGGFGNRLLVTSVANGQTTVFAIDCRGHTSTLTRDAPRVEGGIAVAPRSFGHFGGDLIAPDEITGRIYAIAPSGKSRLVADSGLAHGQDIGVESGGFVPAGFGAGWTALVSDRQTPRNRHPGDDLVLGLTGAALTHHGLHPGDLLLVGEGGGAAIDVSCGSTCRVREIADGPAVAHVEGHVVFSHTR